MLGKIDSFEVKLGGGADYSPAQRYRGGAGQSSF